MDTLDILEQLIQAKEVPGHLVAGNTRKNRAANKRHEMGRTFAGAAAMFLSRSPHGTFEEFKRYTVRRQFYGGGPLMWAVWIFRLISWAKLIWNLWQSRAGNDSN